MLTLYQINNIIDSNVTVNTPNRLLKAITNKCFIYEFIVNFYKSNEFLDKNTVISALIYLHRYNQKKKLNCSNIKHVLETCLILANKYLVDYEISSCGPLEGHVLNVIEWNLYISEKDYYHYKNNINSFIKID